MITGVQQLQGNLDKFGKDALSKITTVMEYTITESEQYAKSAAPWTDRTGNARNSITGSGPTEKGKNIEAYLAIGMFYGVYLEMGFQGRFRVIWPTLEAFTRDAFIRNLRSAGL